MSGIAGIIHFDGRPADPKLLKSMTDDLAHRGPDGISHWVNGSVAFGHCMFRTTAESLQEQQPLTTEDKSLALVMDGRVDNWEELRHQLLCIGAKLRTQADAELVLRAYEAWGENCLSRIDGDFAIAIWDARRQEVFCARDRIGNKPFNYFFDGKTFLFASELHPILAFPGVPNAPNEGMIAEIISDEWMTRDETIWSEIMRLDAAHHLKVSSKGLSTQKYWRPDLTRPLIYKQDEDYLAHYRALLTDIVRRMSRSHAPVAYEVSGGLDSSAIFCIAAELHRGKRLPAPAIDGYTLAFHEDAAANEISYARAVGEYLGVSINEVLPAYHDLQWYADIAKRCRNIPAFPNGAAGTAMCQSMTDTGHRVVLGGSGGDHFLGGSPSYYAEELAQANVAGLIKCLREDLRSTGLKRTSARFVRHGLMPLAPKFVRDLLRPALETMTGEKKRGAFWLSQRMRAVLDERRLEFESQPKENTRRRGQLGLLAAVDYAYDSFAREVGERFGARVGIENRQPFYSREFIEFAFMTPERLRHIGDRTKVIHVEGLKGLLPEIVRLRKTKADFAGTFDSRLHTLKDFFTARLPLEHSDWLSADGMCILWKSYLDSPQDGWQNWALWQMLAIHMALRGWENAE